MSSGNTSSLSSLDHPVNPILVCLGLNRVADVCASKTADIVHDWFERGFFAEEVVQLLLVVFLKFGLAKSEQDSDVLVLKSILKEVLYETDWFYLKFLKSEARFHRNDDQAEVVGTGYSMELLLPLLIRYDERIVKSG